MIITGPGRRPKSNDKIPKDELLLAKLIQNAQAHNLTSTRGTRFIDAAGSDLGHVGPYGLYRKPPKGAVACCALGAAQLKPPIDFGKAIHAVIMGNDDDLVPAPGESSYATEAMIGATFREALEG